MTNPACPVLRDVDLIQDLSKNMAKTMRKLRRDVVSCQNCASGYDCEVLKTFNQKVQTAIDEVNDEWDQETEIKT
jgi:hypothetical protein